MGKIILGLLLFSSLSFAEAIFPCAFKVSILCSGFPPQKVFIEDEIQGPNFGQAYFETRRGRQYLNAVHPVVQAMRALYLGFPRRSQLMDLFLNAYGFLAQRGLPQSVEPDGTTRSDQAPPAGGGSDGGDGTPTGDDTGSAPPTAGIDGSSPQAGSGGSSPQAGAGGTPPQAGAGGTPGQPGGAGPAPGTPGSTHMADRGVSLEPSRPVDYSSSPLAVQAKECAKQKKEPEAFEVKLTGADGSFEATFPIQFSTQNELIKVELPDGFQFKRETQMTDESAVALLKEMQDTVKCFESEFAKVGIDLHLKQYAHNKASGWAMKVVDIWEPKTGEEFADARTFALEESGVPESKSPAKRCERFSRQMKLLLGFDPKDAEEGTPLTKTEIEKFLAPYCAKKVDPQ